MCLLASSVALSFVSTPAMIDAINHASLTFAVIGPAVSWVYEIGTMCVRDNSPTVGLNPTIPFIEEGQIIEPLVSVPTANDAKRNAIAAPEPDEEPQALRDNICGFRVNPPTALQPLIEDSDRKLAHSERLVLPNTMAPAALRRATMGASRFVSLSTSAIAPAVVGSSLVSILSFSNTGIPNSGPLRILFLRAKSAALASSMALGLSAKILFTSPSSFSILAR